MIKENIIIPITHPMLQEKNFFLWRNRGLLCVISRMSYSGVLNGYVGVPKSHPDHGSHYDEVRLDVHGGLTYLDAQLSNLHEDIFPDTWWFGFVSNHSCDNAPYNWFSWSRKDDGTYRDFDYVLAEVNSMAMQLKDRE